MMATRRVEILSFDAGRTTNDEAVADLAKLGLCPEPVLDLTYGRGTFWKLHRPAALVTNDLRVAGCDHAWDFTEPLPADHHGRYATVVFDPPYKLNGTPTDTDRYGADEALPVAERLRRVEVGTDHAAALVAPGGLLWVKYQDQVANGEMHWLSDLVRDQLPGWTREARLFVAARHRPQRSQTRPRNNYSTLEVWRRRSRATA